MASNHKILTSLVVDFVTFVARWPWWLLFFISDIVAFCLKIFGYRKNIIRDNLSTSFPEKNKKELRQIERSYYQHVADLIVETIKLINIPKDKLSKRITVKNVELADSAISEERPVFLYIAHYGNWEWVPYLTQVYSNEFKSFYIYKPLRDGISASLFKKIRGRFKSIGLTQNQTVRALLSENKNNNKFIVGFISDQRANSKVCHQRTYFLNHSTPFMAGAEVIGNKVNAKFLYLDIYKPRRGYYIFNFKEIIPSRSDEDFPITRQYFRLLEDTIRRDPPFWLWSHRRWLYK